MGLSQDRLAFVAESNSLKSQWLKTTSMHIWETLLGGCPLYDDSVLQFSINMNFTFANEGRCCILAIKCLFQETTHNHFFHGQVIMHPHIPNSKELGTLTVLGRKGELEIGKHLQCLPHTLDPASGKHLLSHPPLVSFPWITGHLVKTYGVELRTEDQIIL